MLRVKFLVICLVFLEARSQKSIGDQCSLKSGISGDCTLMGKCQKVLDDLKNRRIFPETCGFKNREPIVCCARPQSRTPGEISRTKCAEYSEFVFEKYRSPVATINADVITRNECGHKVIPLIIGGEPAGRKEFPHMAAIGFEMTPGDYAWSCGGTIISELYILTAAHCLSSPFSGNPKRVRIGMTNLTSLRNRQEIEISDLIAHPEYKFPSHYNDIGLIKLKRKARLNSFARPACLYSKPKITAKRAIATGWGDTTTAGDKKSEILLKVILKFVDHDDCDARYRRIEPSRKLRSGILENIQVCAGSGTTEIKDTCMGDSGGPLQIYHAGDDVKCMYDIVGVTSFGQPCTGSAGVYAKVSNYIKWIEDVVWPEA